MEQSAWCQCFIFQGPLNLCDINVHLKFCTFLQFLFGTNLLSGISHSQILLKPREQQNGESSLLQIKFFNEEARIDALLKEI